MGLSFTIAAGPRQRINSRVRFPWVSRPYFTLSDSRLPFIVASCDWQGYGGGILPRLHTGAAELWKSMSRLCYDRRFSRPARLGIKHPSLAEDQIFITVRQLQACWCGALSLTRGRICRLPDCQQ
jgi:hypothetical protein